MADRERTQKNLLSISMAEAVKWTRANLHEESKCKTEVKLNIRYYSVPDKRGVSGQKTEKADFLT